MTPLWPDYSPDDVFRGLDPPFWGQVASMLEYVTHDVDEGFPLWGRRHWVDLGVNPSGG